MVSTDFLFIDGVTESECPEFNTFELDQINKDKFIAVTYLEGQTVGVYIFKINKNYIEIVPLWTIWEEA